MYSWLRQLIFPRAVQSTQVTLPQEDTPPRPSSEHARLDVSANEVSASPPPGDCRADAAFMGELATGLWRIQRSVHRFVESGGLGELRAVCRHVESTLDVLAKEEVEIRDDTGTEYVPGMALTVVAFQPTEGTVHETVYETIRPSVYYKGRLIQRGQVIVATAKSVECGSHRDSLHAGPEAGNSEAQLQEPNVGRDGDEQSKDINNIIRERGQ